MDPLDDRPDWERQRALDRQRAKALSETWAKLDPEEKKRRTAGMRAGSARYWARYRELKAKYGDELNAP